MYKAIVAKIDSIEPIEGADRIVQASVLGSTVVVSNDIEVGTIGIFFGVDGQLSEDYAKYNNLIRKKDKDGNQVGGFLEDNRRIRCLKLKGVKSDGLFMPLTSLSYLRGKGQWEVGMAFDELAGEEICRKYVSPATIRAQQELLRGKRVKRGETEMFKKHLDTDQLFYYMTQLKKGDRLIITQKLHGTSGRVGFVRDVLPQTWLQRFFKMAPKYQWVFMSGTRNVITSDENRDTAFHCADMRDAADKLFEGKLHKGETVYFELVGYEPTGKPIMDLHSMEKLDKNEKLTYQNNQYAHAKQIVYNYGKHPGEMDVYVYRIAIRNEDGHSVDYSWEDLKQRCAELNVKHVPELEIIAEYDGKGRELQKYILEKYDSQPDFIDPSHPLEGICLRVESGLNPKIYKNKTYQFKYLEGIAKDNDNAVDAEEAA